MEPPASRPLRQTFATGNCSRMTPDHYARGLLSELGYDTTLRIAPDPRSEAVLEVMRRDPNPDLQAAFRIS